MSGKIQDVYIVAATRTPVGKFRGAFANTRPDDLLSHVLKAALAKVPDLNPESIQDVIVGCAMPEGEQGMNVARISALLAGYPESVPAMTINRFCSSGLQAISLAADKIALGHAEVVVAGGVESMSCVPMGGHHFSQNPNLFTSDKDHIAIAYGMGITAEKVAQKYGITRAQQDEFALLSHQRAIAAIENNAFSNEIAPFAVTSSQPDLSNQTVASITKKIIQDEGPRRDTSLEVLAKLRTVFDAKGTVTAGNTSQMSDGAAALVLVSEKIISQYDLQPLARFKVFSVRGVAPEFMGIGPVEAIPSVLEQCKVKLSDIDWIELNEAFAAQALAVIQELNLNRDIVNPLGGAIALGHPLGATGAIRATTLIHGLRQRQQRYGLVSMCIGTGMGAAGLFEVL